MGSSAIVEDWEVMKATVSIRGLLAIVISFLGALLIIAAHNRQNLQDFWTVAIVVARFSIVCSRVPLILDGHQSYLMGTSTGLILPAIILTYTLTGTHDFSRGGILFFLCPFLDWPVWRQKP